MSVDAVTAVVCSRFRVKSCVILISSFPDNCSPVFLSSRRQLTSMTSICGYPQYFVSLCRRYGLLKNDRVTLLSPMDHLIAIQLRFAEKNKQVCYTIMY